MTDESHDEPRYSGDAIVLDTEAERLKHEAIEAQKHENEYKKAQLETNQLIARFTGLLVVCSLLTGVIAIWQATIAQNAATAAQRAANAASDSTELTFWALKDSEETSAFTLGQMAAQSAAQETSAKAAMGNLENNRQLRRSFQRPYVWAKAIPNNIRVELSNGRHAVIPMQPLGNDAYWMMLILKSGIAAQLQPST